VKTMALLIFVTITNIGVVSAEDTKDSAPSVAAQSVKPGCKGNACHDLRWQTLPNSCIEVTNTSERSISVTLMSTKGGRGKALSGGQSATFNWSNNFCITPEIYIETIAKYH